MAKNDKSIYEEIENHRIYANQEGEKVERDLRELEDEARDYAGRVFTDPSAASALFWLSTNRLEPEHKLLEHADRLMDDPQEFGRLKGLSFLPESQAALQPHLEKIRDCLRDHVDLVAVRTAYRDLHQEAIRAARMLGSQGEEASRQLALSRDYCDTKRDTTHQRAMERRRDWR